MSRSILGNTVIASAGRVATIALGVLVTALITRYLGVLHYGQYAAILSVATIVQIAADFGLYLTLSQEVARSPERTQRIVSNITSLRLLLLLLGFFFGGLFVLVVPVYKGSFSVFGVVALGLIFQSLSQLLMGVFQAKRTVWGATIGDIAGRIVQIIVIVAVSALVSATSPFHAAVAFMLGACIAYGIHSALVPGVRSWMLQYSFSEWKRYLKTSWPLGAMLILNVAYVRLDMVMLPMLGAAHEVGLYGLSTRIIESLLFFPAMFGGLLLPAISRALAQGDRGYVARIISQSIHIVLAIGIMMYIVLTTFASRIVVFLSGTDFIGAAPFLTILSIALLIMYLGNIFGFVLVAHDRKRTLMVLYGVLLVCNATLNWIAIPLFGADAAAWTTVLTEALSAGIAGFIVYRLCRYAISLKLAVAVAGAAIASLLIAHSLPANTHIIVSVSGTIAVYGIVLWALGGIRREEIRLLI